jgi:DNA polymerase-1
LDKVAANLGLGKAYSAFGGGMEGLRACAAMDALCDVAAIDTLLSNFIIPLQGDAIKCSNGRIHCSMNINTETGRLSARRPNLQNQPALEKDRYKIRKAFTADVKDGKTLIVADYGQLELRLLAHMTGCVSMLDAFERGGDFHSRTALGMYEHIQEAVDEGKCLLEWDGGHEGKAPPVPLIKDMFATERRKAKVLNFSIAYGKTAHGLAKDWKVSLREADETLNRWYRDRPEVKLWQDERIVEAHQLKSVRTLLGRQRHLHQINSKSPGVRKHFERAAINTPIQGGAADIAMLAMIEIERNEELRDLGWRLLLQVHDEVMLEGPAESKERALELVRQCMEYPFQGTNPLTVALSVDAKTADTWYEAK